MNNKESANSPKTTNENDKKQRFLPNNQYFTICIYVMVMIVLGALTVRVIITPYAVTDGIMKILNVLMPFLMGIFIAMILNPTINRIYYIMRKYLKVKGRPKFYRGIAAAIAYVFILGLIITCIVFVVPQLIISLTDLVNSTPKLYQTISDLLERFQERFPNTDISEAENVVNSILPNMINYMKNLATNVVPALYTASISILKGFANTLIAIIVSGYILADKKNLKKMVKVLLYSFVPKEHIETSVEILHECNHIFTNFIVSKALDSLIIGCICFIFMTIFGFDYALLISAIVGITNMIPYFGPFIGAVPGAVILLMISPWRSLGFVIWILILQQFDGLYLGPKIMGESVGIKPLWIIISITLGGKIAGIFGMFVSVPIAAILIYLAQILIDHQLEKRNIDKESL